ncbi:MAG: tRNA pseudouridine(55) synthase TruB [Deltaproteobacteria bacterium]|jgi:tRNA pseudouridine55 synthase|nr:tRNA pseudouridine(55) synthase TruB [Deltaproteobacteria bacterium]
MKTNKNNAVSGILVIDKPKDMTSFKVDCIIKKELNCSKVGHAGTLDPFATGVLPILLNKATKLQDSLVNLPKSYEGTLKLGVSTDTLDITGCQNGERSISDLEIESIISYLNNLKGDFIQKIPAFSARKHKGVPLYKYARKNIDVVLENPTSVVKIYNFEVNSHRNPFIDFRCTVSKGTYVRAIAQDIMDKFDIPAHLYGLKRTSAGGFDISEALPLESLEKGSDFIIENLKHIN